MPICFQLIRKDSPHSGPAILNHVDTELCALTGLEWDPNLLL
jgi:hypothetical protein